MFIWNSNSVAKYITLRIVKIEIRKKTRAECTLINACDDGELKFCYIGVRMLAI